MQEALFVCDHTSMVTLAGEIDLATSPSLAERLASIDTPELVIDSAQLEFIESTGLSVLADTDRRLRASGGGVHLVRVNDHVARLVCMIGYDDWLES